MYITTYEEVVYLLARLSTVATTPLYFLCISGRTLRTICVETVIFASALHELRLPGRPLP